SSPVAPRPAFRSRSDRTTFQDTADNRTPGLHLFLHGQSSTNCDTPGSATWAAPEVVTFSWTDNLRHFGTSFHFTRPGLANSQTWDEKAARSTHGLGEKGSPTPSHLQVIRRGSDVNLSFRLFPGRGNRVTRGPALRPL